MNTHFRPPDLPKTTRGAEGMERRLWTVAEIEAMVAAGILDEDERFELIEGEVVPMSPKGVKHEHVKNSLAEFWMSRKNGALRIAFESTLKLDGSSFIEPDFIFFDSKVGLANITPKRILLAVEVADSSLRYDLGRKAEIYAAHGVAMVWVIDAETLRAHCFAKPSADGYLERRVIEPHEVLVPGFAQELAVKLAELPLI
jgi:Uma2 family endonuclease